MIAEIRKHIKDSIYSCSKLYKQIDNPFHKDEDTPGSDPDYRYAIIFGASTKIIDDNLGNVLEIPVNLKTYRQGNRDKLASFDENCYIVKSLVFYFVMCKNRAKRRTRKVKIGQTQRELLVGVKQWLNYFERTWELNYRFI